MMEKVENGSFVFPCWLCGNKGQIFCDDCESVAACDILHLSLHQQQKYCRPWRVRRNQQAGRFMVATRDIEPLETILVESPFVTGPCRDGQLVCVECLTVLNDTTNKCHLCHLPLCSQPQCQEVNHHQLECRLIKKSKWKCTPDSLAAALEGLTTIRMISKKKILTESNSPDPAIFDLSLGSGDIPEIDLRVVEEAKHILADDFDEEEFHQCYHQLYINGKSLNDKPGIQTSRGTGLYLLFSIMNHSCLANTLTYLTSSGEIKVKAQKRILAGEEISCRYGGLNLGQPRRGQLLFDHWHFSCNCAREQLVKSSYYRHCKKP